MCPMTNDASMTVEHSALCAFSSVETQVTMDAVGPSGGCSAHVVEPFRIDILLAITATMVVKYISIEIFFL